MRGEAGRGVSRIRHPHPTLPNKKGRVFLFPVSPMFRLLLILSLLLSAPAYAQYGDNERIDQLEKQVNTLERAVYRGQTPPAPAGDDVDVPVSGGIDVRL